MTFDLKSEIFEYRDHMKELVSWYMKEGDFFH